MTTRSADFDEAINRQRDDGAQMGVAVRYPRLSADNRITLRNNTISISETPASGFGRSPPRLKVTTPASGWSTATPSSGWRAAW